MRVLALLSAVAPILTAAVVMTGGGTAGAAGDPAVCGYMDRLKAVWNSTEPSAQEKTAVRTASERFQNGSRDRRELDALDRTLASFAGKVQRRINGTRALAAPVPAAEVRRLGLDFLDKVDEAVRLSRKLIAEMNTPAPDEDLAERTVDRLQWLDAAVQRVGTLFNREVVRVRGRFGCGPP
jgi:hypothetical protein